MGGQVSRGPGMKRRQSLAAAGTRMTAICTCAAEGVEDLGPGIPPSAYAALQAQCRKHGALCLAGCGRPAAVLVHNGQRGLLPGRGFRLLCDPCREEALGAEKAIEAGQAGL